MLRIFESESTDITDLYISQESQKAKKIVLSQYNSTIQNLRDNGIELYFNYENFLLDKQFIEFYQKEITIDLGKKVFETSLMNHKTLTYKVDTFDRIRGNVFEFKIKPESALEAISDIIKLEPHVMYIGTSTFVNGTQTKLVSKSKNLSLDKIKEFTMSVVEEARKIAVKDVSFTQNLTMADPTLSIPDSNPSHKKWVLDPVSKPMSKSQNCSLHINLYSHSLIRNQTQYKFKAFFDSLNYHTDKEGLYIEFYQMWVCRSKVLKSSADIFIRAIWNNKTLHTQTFPQALSNVFINDYNSLHLNYQDHILTLTALENSSRRVLYADLYFFDVFQMLNQTVEVEIEAETLQKFPIVEYSQDQEVIDNNTNIRQMARRYQMLASLDIACYNEYQQFEDKREAYLRNRACSRLKKYYIEYKMHLKFITRHSFKLQEHDYLLKGYITNGDFNTGQENFNLFPLSRDINKDYLMV